ncbi:MAG TPA: glycosyltransferase family 87 protein [Candidatus Udaeobacter sp.]|nr:glycosyltransferase family 87 protein [Candidatus Udaeobacter sp.]
MKNQFPYSRHLNSPVALRRLLWAFVVTATIFSVLPLLRYLRGHTIFDYELWYATGKHVRAGDEIYFFRAGKYDFMYPPPCAFFLAGASLLGQGGLIFLLVAINSAAWFCSAKLSAVLARGDERATHPWLYLIPSLLVIVYVWSSYHLGQPNLVLLALMVGAFSALRAKRETVAGSLIAVAAAIKAFPVLAIIYLVYRRYWKAAAGLVATLVFLLLILPAPFRGFEGAWHDVEKWSAGMLKYSEVTVGQRPMRSYTWKNQSLVGVTNRLLRHVDADAASAPHEPVYVNFAELKFPVVNAIIIGLALGLGISFIAVMPQRAMRTADTDSIEFALLLLLMLMLTPLSFGYFYSWLMLPFAVVTRRVLAGKSSTILCWSLPAVALVAFGIPFPRGAQLYGNTFFATLLLFIGLSIELFCLKQRTNQQQPIGDSMAS